MNYKLGALLSPINERNYTLAHLGIPTNTTFPDEFCRDLSDWKPKNQGQIGKCVGESISYNRFLTEDKQSGIKVPFSEDWIYFNRKSTDYQGSGMFPQQAYDNLLHDGVPYQSDFHIDKEYPDGLDDFNKIKSSLLGKARLYKISAYCQINTIDEIKTALMCKDLNGVDATIPVYTSFDNTGSDGMVVKPNPTTETFRGYHRITIVGWKNGRWICLNSWDYWGDNGIFFIEYDFPLFEILSSTDKITPQPPLVKTYWKVQACANLFKCNAQKNEIKINADHIDTCLVKEGLFWKVQCGVFTDEANKNDMVARLEKLGFKPYVITYTK